MAFSQRSLMRLDTERACSRHPSSGRDKSETPLGANPRMIVRTKCNDCQPLHLHPLLVVQVRLVRPPFWFQNFSTKAST